MSIFRTTDPTQFDDVDGIVINESAPPPSIAGVAANIAILVGQFSQGPYELTEVGSTAELRDLFGTDQSKGNLALMNKRFGRLRIIRVQGTGTAGAVTDTDYQTAIAKAEVEGSGNFIFLDEYNTVRNGYLKDHVAATQDKMAIVAGPEVQTVAEAITDVALNRDADGRLIYAFPWVQTSIAGVATMQSPASWYASILSQTSPHVDPAYVKNTQFLGGITGLKMNMSRAQYILLVDAGISAFEIDGDIGAKVKSGVTSQIADSSKKTVLRRRMADFLTASVAKFLKSYQNAPNSKDNRSQVKGAMLSFIQGLEQAGVLPRDSELKSGKAKVVDTESLNSDAGIAAGEFKILWRQRIYSSMRYIVLQAEIGESVVVKEGE